MDIHNGHLLYISLLSDFLIKRLFIAERISRPERYEAIASLPDKVFEQHIQDIKQSNEELTLRRIRGCPLPVILCLTSVVKLLEYRQNNLYLL